MVKSCLRGGWIEVERLKKARVLDNGRDIKNDGGRLACIYMRFFMIPRLGVMAQAGGGQKRYEWHCYIIHSLLCAFFLVHWPW